MNITIIGNGNMAKGIGTRLLTGGHAVTIHSKDEAKGTELVDQLKLVSHSANVSLQGIGGQLEDIVVLAVPYTEVGNVAKNYDGFAGKTVIDITNPVDFNTFQLIPEAGKSGAQEIARLVPDATVIKAFNTTLAGPLTIGAVEDKELDVFVAGDDDQAKKTVCELVKSSGMRPVVVGPLAEARHLEGFGLIQMKVQDQIGTNWMSALKFIG